MNRHRLMRNIMMMGKGITYSMRDEFTDTLAAGSVNGTLATDGVHTRTVVDTGNKLSLSGGKLVLTPTAGNDPYIQWGTLARSEGRILIFRINLVAANTDLEAGLCFTNVITGGNISLGLSVEFFTNGRLYWYPGTVDVAAYSAATDYWLAIIYRSVGGFLFIKGGAFAVWTLLAADKTVTHNCAIGILTVSASATIDFVRSPDILWTPSVDAAGTITDGVDNFSNGSDGRYEAALNKFAL